MNYVAKPMREYEVAMFLHHVQPVCDPNNSCNSLSLMCERGFVVSVNILARTLCKCALFSGPSRDPHA
jgi:hypothetical protein